MRPRMNWRHQYDEDSEILAQLDTVIVNEEPSLTNQHFRKDADINEIMRRFGVTDGAVPPAAMDPQHFGDFTDAVDFREALDRTRAAQQTFDALPASLRNRFGNDPVDLWRFVNDPKNWDEAVTLGLLKREPAPPSTPTTEPSAPPAST